MKKSIFGLPWSKITRGVARLRTVVNAPAWLAMLRAEDERLQLLGQEWQRIFLPTTPKVLPFTEPEAHQKARAILGANFHGILAAQKCFGPYAPEDLERHIPLRLCDASGNPFTHSDEETLAVCEECKDTHILVAMQSLSLPNIHARCKSRMANDQNAPWFGERPQREQWSSQVIRGTWLLFRKDVVPDSWNKAQAAQQQHLALHYTKERLVFPAEYAYGALLHQQETGEKLCRGYWVRFPVQTADGHWVSAHWDGEQLNVNRLSDGASVCIASCAARAAS
ncbi:MAG: hypothetical protein PHX87_01755 [Candidatus Peribacteraceae bacterium]|nr:hypothetical protein [Candidatus Peribacteraceae bacterium]MDD5742133.1 hypothetical protein [Candidatus Peribacteraceae bacterium]